jgi:hypothetical protein
LQGSIFKNFLISGSALVGFVGGSALPATILLIRKQRFAVFVSAVTGIIIMFFEFAEILAIGSPPGIARTLQIFYFDLGTIVVILAPGIWLIDLISKPE